MKECLVNIKRIALNLTDDEFCGYCKGMSLHWLFRGIDNPSENPKASKRVEFWDKAYDRYKL